MDRIAKVVIVGGGTAGWMAAATLARAMPGLIDIELVESDQIGTVGVGEATIPQIRLLLSMLDLDESDFLARTNGTYKLGIQFRGWGKPGDVYSHVFGAIGRSLGMLEFYPYWLRARAEGHAGDLWSYSLNAVTAAQNRYQRYEQFGDTGLSGLVCAYHFDASLVARYLREYAERRDVRRTEGMVVETTLHPETGYIDSLTLDDGATVSGDLFIDCSGFRGLLIEQALGAGYEDWTHWLPCDRAAAVPCATVDPLLPYTQATAREAGWQWRIPLQHRTGNGYVYSSEYLSDDEAVDTLLNNLDGEPQDEPRLLRFTTGRRKSFWEKNCVALGLASGFLEPLESTSIHLVQAGLSRLISLFPNGGFSDDIIDEYNRQCVYEFERVRDFIILHYHANNRSGSEFWVDRRQMAVPESLTHRIELFRTTGRIQDDADDLFKTVAWLQVMIGQGIVPEQYHPLADTLTDEQLRKFLGDIQRVIDVRASSFADHRDYVEQHCAAPR